MKLASMFQGGDQTITSYEKPKPIAQTGKFKRSATVVQLKCILQSRWFSII